MQITHNTPTSCIIILKWFFMIFVILNFQIMASKEELCGYHITLLISYYSNNF